MKKAYLKPEVVIIDLSIKENIMDAEDEDIALMNDIPGGSMGNAGEFPF